MRNEGVRRIEDGRERAIVLLQLDHSRIREIVFETEDVPDVRSPPRVHGLVVIADHRDLPVFLGEQLHQQVLRAVGVLILIHQDMPEEISIVRKPFREEAQNIDHAHEQVVEVQGVGLQKAGLIAAIHGRCGAPQARRVVIIPLSVVPAPTGSVPSEVVNIDQLVLGVGDDAVQGFRRVPLDIQPQVFQTVAHEPDGVILVVDAEVGRVPEEGGILPQHARTRGVEGGHPSPARGGPKEPGHPLLHLPGGFVGEGDGQGLVRLYLPAFDEISKPVGEHPGLPGARAGQDQQRPRRLEDGLLLAVVEILC